MQAIRQIIRREDIAALEVPAEYGDCLEVIILPASSPQVSPESWAAMAVQERSGFAQEVLAAPSEDVWNDLRPGPDVPQDR